MFNKQNFCHIASNNRNEVKVGVFVYKTTDNLATVTTSGYFNEKIVDINLHDLIIHEWHNPTDRTKVQRNVLCVTERTLDNVGTQIIKTDWEEQTDETLEQLATDISGKVSKSGDTMTGALEFSNSQGSDIGITKSGSNSLRIYKKTNADLEAINLEFVDANRLDVCPIRNNAMSLGALTNKLKTVYTSQINNGSNLAVPNPGQADTIALKSEVDLAANSGDQLTNKGVWYAKMYAATVAPAAEDGTNYADFSQTDGQGNPIIVLYERQSGAWVQTDTITPPADYNGYVTVTSKIWDIVEQAGQQGGKVLWSHNTKTFTPYPQIISFEDAALTGNSTVVMPQTPTGNSIVNVDYLSNHSGGAGNNVGDIFFTRRTDNGLAGAVECNGATYDTTDFVGSGNIGGLLADGKVPYVSLSAYASEITAKGWCDKFGWDGVNTTQFRVPTLNAYIWQKITAGIKGSIGKSSATARGEYFVAQSTSFTQETLPAVGGYTISVTNDQTIPGASVDTTDTVSDLRVMVQLATGATDQALETCTSVLADVAELKYDYVVDFQAPTAANNYTWYRKYKSGWVEQGGQTSTDGTQTLPITMADTNYTVMRTNGNGRSAITANELYTSVGARTTTTIYLVLESSIAPVFWEVKGMAAQ